MSHHLYLGIARLGGGLNPCPDGLGHFFKEEFSKFKRAFAWFWGGLNPCPDGLGHLFRENGKQNGKNGKMVKSRLKKSAPECPFECGGGGGKCYLGNAQIEVVTYWKGLPLIAYSLNIWKDYFHEPILNYQSSTGKKLSA